MNQKKLALFYITVIVIQYASVTFAQPGGGGGKDNGGGFNQPGKDGKGGHEEQHVDDDGNPNHWDDKKWIYRCADKSTVASVVPNFGKSKTSDDVLRLFVTQIKCSKIKEAMRSIPFKCQWYPTICPEETIYIEGSRKQVSSDGNAHFEHNCCVHPLVCNSQCQTKKAVLESGKRVHFFPENQLDSDQVAPSISSLIFEDTDGKATVQWKFCENTTLCYTPPPGTPGGDGGAPPPGCGLGCLGLLGLLALLALIGTTSSSSAPAASTAAG